MRFLKQVAMTGIVRRKAFTIKELKNLVVEQESIEIPNMYANYETLKNFILDPQFMCWKSKYNMMKLKKLENIQL